MKRMLEENIPIEMNQDTLIGYGGFSRVYYDPQVRGKKCYKMYRESVTGDKLEIAKQNFRDLSRKKTARMPELVLPSRLILDRDGNLTGQELPFLSCYNFWKYKYLHYGKKEYLTAMKRFLYAVRNASKQGIVITDFKLGNVLVSDEAVYMIDNDFSFNETNPELDRLTSVFKNHFMKEYLANHNQALDSNYNYYILTFITALLMFSPDELQKVIPYRTTPNLHHFAKLNKVIQIEHDIPKSFRMLYSDTLKPEKGLTFNREVEEDVVKYFKRISK